MRTWWKNLQARMNRSKALVDRPIFIIGCGRSGTTLLFQLLRRHPQVAPTTGYPDGEDHVGWNAHGGCYISGLGHPGKEAGHTGYHYCIWMKRISNQTRRSE